MNIINDVFSSINLNTVFVLGACCMGVLIFGGIIGFVMQFLGFGLGIVFNFVEIFFHVISGGPLAWCGCLMVIFGCGACSLLTIAVLSILPNCGTAQAVNLCRLFGS